MDPSLPITQTQITPPGLVPPTQTDPTLPSKPSPKTDPKLLLLLGAIALFIVLIITGVAFALSVISSALNSLPRPTPVSQTQEPEPIEITVPTSSKFATDSAILKLKQSLRETSLSLDTLDLFEPKISPPAIDLNLKIQSN